MKFVLLAAGSSRRMNGRDKLLEDIEGLPLLRRQALVALAAGIGPVAVTLPPERPARLAAIADLDIAVLTIRDAQTGMSASLRAAAEWASGDALMICPADMPDVTAEDMRTLAAEFDGATLRAVDMDGTAGHPVIFPARMLTQFATLSGDEGARRIMQGTAPWLIPLPDHHATTDLDTPEAWAAWRARQPGR